MICENCAGSECENGIDDSRVYLQGDSYKSKLSECMEIHRHSLLCSKQLN